MASSASRPERALHAEARLFEIPADEFGDVAVVLDDQDARHEPAAMGFSVTVGANANAAAASAREM